MCLPFLCKKGVKNMGKRKNKRKHGVRASIIKRQSDEIKSLKEKIKELNATIAEKDKLIQSVEPLRQELKNNIEGVREKRKECDAIMEDLKLMRKAFNKEVFKGRWNIVKFLIK